MIIDWVHWTPYSALAGGALIGLAAAWLMLGHGRIAGISGIVSGLISAGAGDRLWRWLFVLGLALSPLIAYWFAGEAVVPTVVTSPLTLIAAGLLVGFGVRLGSGCTSGHGVCGLARLSPRSLAATLLFMAAGFAVVYGLRHGGF